MPGQEVTLGPFVKGLHNSAGTGEYIANDELFDLVNLEVDTDGSLANRPAISSLVPSGLSGRFKIIGTFYPSGGSKYLVLSYGSNFATVGLYNIATNSIAVSRSIKSNVAVQYNNNIWIIPASDGTAATGGYYNSAATPAWTAVTTMPQGDDAVIYKDRLCITAGLLAPNTSDSTLYRSCVLHPEAWFGDAIPVGQSTNDAGNVPIEPGNGQRLISLLVMNNDLVLFKEHSTFRYVISSDPSKAELSKISSTIGTPYIKCAVSFDNNNIYLIHDNSIYELYNYTFTKLSMNLAMQQVVDADIFSDSNYGLSLFRNRLFIRYYSKFYTYSLLTGRWSRWVSTKKFGSVFVVPSSTTLDTVYAHSISSSDPIELHYFQDDRVINVGLNESFNCSIVTKTYDFDMSWSFKVIFWWGMTIASSGATTATVQVPNASYNYTWAGLNTAMGSWGAANASHILWSNNPPVISTSTVPSEKGSYARKFLKFNKKLRFRQLFFTISTPALNNTVGDACVRIYDLSVFLHQKETVSARTT